MSHQSHDSTGETNTAIKGHLFSHHSAAPWMKSETDFVTETVLTNAAFNYSPQTFKNCPLNLQFLGRKVFGLRTVTKLLSLKMNEKIRITACCVHHTSIRI